MMLRILKLLVIFVLHKSQEPNQASQILAVCWLATLSAVGQLSVSTPRERPQIQCFPMFSLWTSLVV